MGVEGHREIGFPNVEQGREATGQTDVRRKHLAHARLVQQHSAPWRLPFVGMQEEPLGHVVCRGSNSAGRFLRSDPATGSDRKCVSFISGASYHRANALLVSKRWRVCQYYLYVVNVTQGHSVQRWNVSNKTRVFTKHQTMMKHLLLSNVNWEFKSTQTIHAVAAHRLDIPNVANETLLC